MKAKVQQQFLKAEHIVTALHNPWRHERIERRTRYEPAVLCHRHHIAGKQEEQHNMLNFGFHIFTLHPAVAVGTVTHSDSNCVHLAGNGNINGGESLGNTRHGHHSTLYTHRCNSAIGNLCAVG